MSIRKQPQRLPPPIAHGPGPLEAEIILRENEGDLAAVLWKTVRSVRLWAETESAYRARAFEPRSANRRSVLLQSAEVPEEIRESLTRAASVLSPRARGAGVARACREIADWAVSQGRVGTGLEFAQAAALAVPDDAEMAHEVARLARTRTEYHRAETWYRQAIARARRSRAWSEFARSYIGLGTVFTLRGVYPQASRSLIRGLRAARRFSFPSIAAAAAHELVVVGIKTDRAPDVTRYARQAIDAYGPDHPRLPALAHDVGIFLLNTGYLETARRVLTSTAADFGRPIDQLARAASLVRLAGAIGDREMYDRELARADVLLAEPTTGPCTVQALLAIARGAESMRDNGRALESANRAAELAGERSEAHLQFAIESVLASIQGSNSAEAAPPARQRTPKALDHLAAEFEAALGVAAR